MKKILLVVSVLLLSISSLSAGQVLLDHVDGSWFDGTYDKLIPGVPVEFHLILINDGTENIKTLTNGFRISGSGGFFMVGTSIFGTNSFLLDISIIDNYGLVTGFKTIISGDGLPPGFNEVAYTLQTGNFIEGDMICLDSTFYGFAGLWRWSGTGGDEHPSWDGPHCFEVAPPCYPPVFEFCPDTIPIFDCYYSYQFPAHNDSSDDSLIRYEIIDGPGAIYNPGGRWSYNPIDTDFGTTQSLTIKTYNANCPSNFSLCTTTLTFADSLVVGDLTFDCFIDIADLVYMVAFMFRGGPPPENPDAFDVNGDGFFDIADLVYLVTFMFQNGPSPIG